MRLNVFDFLSSSPQTFIFNRRSNQTNFGGVLSIIYLLIFISITGLYLISYFNEDNYSIQYLFQEKSLTTEEEINRYKSDRYDPPFNICASLYIDAEKELADRFEIRRYNNILFSQVNTSICHNIKIPDLNWMIVYDCLTDNTSECKIEQNPIMLRSNTIKLYMYFNGFILDHQNKSSPLYRMYDKQVSHSLISSFDLYNPSRRVHTWMNVRYKEEKGFFSMFENGEDNDYIGLTMKTFDYSEMSGLNGDKKIFLNAYDVKSKSIHTYKVLGRIVFDVDFHHYDEYKRTPKSFWDTVANICSLSMTILNGLSYTLLSYFSNNFNNYKIMEKILYNYDNNETKEIKNKENNIIEPIGDINKKEENLIDNKNEDNNALIINEENDKVITDKDFIYDSDKFPELNFFDFLFSGLYDGKCCCKLSKKELIQKCNEIISKYYSIENIIYNLIRLENLMKDYRWNDPRLNHFDNNHLIEQLKNLLSSFNIS